MAVTKSQSLMYMYEKFLKCGKLTRLDTENILEINDLTFHRYIQEIKAYLVNFNIAKEIKFSKRNQEYYLINKEI